ncbi:Orm1 type endoplasmic reticulum protein, partial [Erysiphe pulchra]
MIDFKVGRKRRSSSLIYHEPPETIEHMSDQAALPNLNANWVNAKGQLRTTLTSYGFLWGTILMITTDIFMYLIGAWTIHLVLIICLKILFNIIPGISQETSWTLTNISYMFGSFLMFHWVRGVPFEFNAGAYDNLNMWEQIDNGAQYTPAKKFLLSVPILLFLLSTHYTHYDLTYFTINFLAVLGVVIPKLPYVGLSYLLETLQVLTDTESPNTGWTLFSFSRRSIA